MEKSSPQLPLFEVVDETEARPINRAVVQPEVSLWEIISRANIERQIFIGGWAVEKKPGILPLDEEGRQRFRIYIQSFLDNPEALYSKIEDSLVQRMSEESDKIRDEANITEKIQESYKYRGIANKNNKHGKAVETGRAKRITKDQKELILANQARVLSDTRQLLDGVNQIIRVIRPELVPLHSEPSSPLTDDRILELNDEQSRLLFEGFNVDTLVTILPEFTKMARGVDFPIISDEAAELTLTQAVVDMDNKFVWSAIIAAQLSCAASCRVIADKQFNTKAASSGRLDSDAKELQVNVWTGQEDRRGKATKRRIGYTADQLAELERTAPINNPTWIRHEQLELAVDEVDTPPAPPILPAYDTTNTLWGRSRHEAKELTPAEKWQILLSLENRYKNQKD